MLTNLDYTLHLLRGNRALCVGIQIQVCQLRLLQLI